MSPTNHAGWWSDLDALDRRFPARWLCWADSPRGSHTIRRWAGTRHELRGWSPDELVQPVSGASTDRMQAALVELTQDGSAEAGLTLLVQLRPGLVRLARAAGGWDWIMTDDVDHEVQATFFETLLRHDLGRRGRKIAANLLLDTRQKLWRRFPRAGPPSVSITGDPPVTVDPHWTDEVEAWLRLRDGLRELPGSADSRRLTAAMAYRAWIEDQTTSAIADDFGVAPQTVATRLYRLRRILRTRW